MSKQASRRGFMFKIGSGLMALGGLLVTAPILGYVLAPALTKWERKRSWIDLGRTSDYSIGETVLATYRNPLRGPTAGESSEVACWVRRLSSHEFQVFYVNCAHLGCPVHWFEESKLFMCPCHGGVYYEDGSRASGPPPRGLFEYNWRVANEHLYVFGGELPNLQIPGRVPEDELTPLTIDGASTSSTNEVSAP